ncbi:uncharacterized protein V2V93DRAFT_381582 [Kockiozyma suomiensis]|uniref:uncharacterized protein n=1 Tax=Kockiozyma suomiensis TaxID=1337062 RepID=UPI0033432F95
MNSARSNLPPYKVPCKFYMSGTCRRGSACWFKHGNEVKNRAAYLSLLKAPAESTSDAEPKSSSDASTCMDSSLVNESAGASEAVEILGSMETHDTEQTDSAKEAQIVEAVEELIEESDNSKELCAICLEVPTTYGLLTNCDHVFCLGCIREWRQQQGMASVSVVVREAVSRTPVMDQRLMVDVNTGVDSTFNETIASGSPPQNSRSKLRNLSKCCPLCRNVSDYVVPSSHLPVEVSHLSRTDQLTKKDIIDAYLATLKHIPCKYFVQKRLCRFGNDCFYSHAVVRKPPPITVPKHVSPLEKLEWPASLRRHGKIPPPNEHTFNEEQLSEAAGRHAYFRGAARSRDEVF